MPLTQVLTLRRMFLARDQPIGRGPWRRWRSILAGVYAILAIIIFNNYIEWRSATFFTGVLTLFYTPTLCKRPSGSFRFAWLALAFTGLLFMLPAKTIAFTALTCAGLFYLETFFRRNERTTPFVLALITPIVSYFAETFSFPIRLQLTSFTGRLMHTSGLPVTVAGNTIDYHQQSFSVDPACMGLHLLVVSLLCALFLMNHYQKQLGRRLPIWTICALLLLTAVLNIIANLLRIVCLVLLMLPPENLFHGLLGLIFPGAYVLLPLLPITRYAIRRFGKTIPTDTPKIVRSPRLLLANLLIATLLPVVLIGNTLLHKTPALAAKPNAIPGYSLKQTELGVLQLDNGRSLVYIKPIPGFYYTDHTPTICWKGSGYSFSTLQQATVATVNVYEAELKKDSEKLYTAWWYDNGIHQTIDPWSWRWDALRGSPAYAVVNVTAASQQQLEAEVSRILRTHPFQPLLGTPAPRVKIR
jgi:exosortase N